MSEQTSATAQAVLSSEPDFYHLLQPSFSLCYFYGVLKFAQWVLSPKEENEGKHLSAEVVLRVKNLPLLACVRVPLARSQGALPLFEVNTPVVIARLSFCRSSRGEAQCVV